MSKKTLFIILSVLVLGLLALLLLFFLRGKEEVAVPETPDKPCLIFQSDDPKEPCYASPIPEDQTPTGPSTSTPQAPGAISSVCNSPIAPERDDCITRIAEDRSDPVLCDSIPGAFGRTSCKIKVQSGDRASVDTTLLPKQTAPSYTVNPVVSAPLPSSPISGGTSPADILPKSNAMLEQLREDGQYQIDNPDPAYTIEGFYDRVATISEFKVYTVVPLQAKPGGAATLMGSGFQKTDNTIHIGGETIEGLESLDGMTLRFSIPNGISYGTYEIWVTNSRGSSKDAGQPIRVTVTSNPKPVPEITEVTPENPKSTDRVTLRGNNLSGVIQISTTLGLAESLSFVPAELEFAKEMSKAGILTGKLVPVYVHVATDAGFNPEPFVFNVQF